MRSICRTEASPMKQPVWAEASEAPGSAEMSSGRLWRRAFSRFTSSCISARGVKWSPPRASPLVISMSEQTAGPEIGLGDIGKSRILGI